MYHRVRKKMCSFIISAILLLQPTLSLPKSFTTTITTLDDDVFDNNINIDEEYSVKFNKKYGQVPWHGDDFKDSHKYTVIKEHDDKNISNKTEIAVGNNTEVTTEYYGVIPLELISTTQDALVSIIESTTEDDLTVIPLTTTSKLPKISFDETPPLPTTENSSETTEHTTETPKATKFFEMTTTVTTDTTELPKTTKVFNIDSNETTTSTEFTIYVNDKDTNKSTDSTVLSKDKNITDSQEQDFPLYTELDAEDIEDVPEDYYDSKDVIPTSPPKTDAISVLFGLAGSVVESVVESVAERVVPKSIYDLFKRMQRQNEALEAERLRSREENGGIGQFGRGILKSISSGLSKPLSQLMAAKEAGSLDTDRGFVASVASGVTSVANVANSVVDAFKDKVQAIYPGTVWCGDGHSAAARSNSELGLFFFTDTCCRRHDACKIYIRAGETKYGLTNTGLFTRSHCSCDAQFRECLRRTNSLVSAQIGLTYFNVLGPQCFRKAHPIVKCNKKTRITGQKCEEYELDYTKPKMWQWFDNETF